MRPEVERLREMREQARLGGGEERIEQQHERGKLTARERVELLLDADSFVEFDAFVTHRATDFGLDQERYLGDGVVTGHGTIDGRLVFVFSQDFTVFGGSLSEAHAEKICKIMDLAVRGRRADHRPQRFGRRAHPGRSRLARRLRRHLPAQHARRPGSCRRSRWFSGRAPGGAVYSPAITDFTIMVEGTSYMFVTGPEVVRTVTHEDVDREHLGGASVHTTISGVAHLAARDEAEAMALARRILDHLPQNNLSQAARCDRRPIQRTGASRRSTRVVPD